MTALRQVLAPHNFEKCSPAWTGLAVRRMLRQTGKRMTFDLKQETDWDWNWIDPPSREMIFTATFGPDGPGQAFGQRGEAAEGR